MTFWNFDSLERMNYPIIGFPHGWCGNCCTWLKLGILQLILIYAKFQNLNTNLQWIVVKTKDTLKPRWFDVQSWSESRKNRFKLKNINNIQNFGNNLHSLPKKNNLSLLRSSKKSPQNFSTNLLFLWNNLSRSETFQKFQTNLVNFVTNLENFLLQKLWEKLCSFT